MPPILSQCLLWLVWAGFALCSILTDLVIPSSFGKYNSFDGPFGGYGVTLVLLPIIVCGGLRYLIARMGRGWLVHIPFFFGVLTAFFAGQFGLYMLSGYLALFQILCAALFLLYLPLFVKFPRGGGPPPLPS